MVIRYEGDDNIDKIYYLEATSDEGVVMKSFDNTRLNIGEFFEKIVWRRLNYTRTHESIAKINKFVQQAHGRQFHFSMFNLINDYQSSELLEPGQAPFEESKNFEQQWRESMSSQLNAVQEDDSMAVSMINLEDQRRFFCSELVMKALKECKILKYNQERSSNFLPADLTSEK